MGTQVSKNFIYQLISGGHSKSWKETYIGHLGLNLCELGLVVRAGIDIATTIRDLLNQDIAGDEVNASRVDLVHEDRQRMRARLQAVIGSVANGGDLDSRLLTSGLGRLALANSLRRVKGVLSAGER